MADCVSGRTAAGDKENTLKGTGNYHLKYVHRGRNFLL